ncbi:MAG: hypothetical protein JJU02_06335 [Cryomorphaceae bacterium]|nr:hypothetical protein [Cryomorphaceae bacterium]
MNDNSSPELVHLDKDLAVAFKPWGWVVDGKGKNLREWLMDEIKADDSKWGPHPIHFIDKAVCGLVVFARKKSIFVNLQKSMQNGQFKKLYVAKCNPMPILDVPLLVKHYHIRIEEGRRAKMLLQSKPGAKYAALKILEVAPYVKIQLITGRFHQIRAQLSTLGFPIVGDTLYNDENKTAKSIKLCAASIAFPHPANGEMLSLSVKPPF